MTSRPRASRTHLTILGLIAGGCLTVACSGSRPADLGLVEGALRPCPGTPNCVSSDAPSGDDHHSVAAQIDATETAAL